MAEPTLPVVTNEQLYLAIGIPMIFNAALIGLSSARMNARIDARLKHLEER